MKIFFAPDYPEPLGYLLTNILNHLDYEVVLDPTDDFDLAGLWEDKTFLDVPPVLQEVSKTKAVINLRCTDISKELVERLFVELFGYSSLVDPTTYQGLCIKKPDLNCVDYGELAQCPVEKKEEDFVYQKFIDSSVDGFQWEYRMPIIFDEIPMVYMSKRDYPKNSSLKGIKRHQVLLKPVDEVFSADEISKILKFCHKIGMDIGELDILKDKHDGRIYIIDANKTAAGYALVNKSGWSPGDKKKMVALLAASFDRGLAGFIKKAGRQEVAFYE